MHFSHGQPTSSYIFVKEKKQVHVPTFGQCPRWVGISCDGGDTFSSPLLGLFHRR